MPGFFSQLFSRDVPKVKEPTLGILDLSGGEGAEIAAGDQKTLGPLFARVVTSTDQVPPCSVLLLYCKVDLDGKISTSPLGLREIIRESSAPVVILALPSSNESYVATGQRKAYGATVVFVLDRKGEAFGTFFHRLFTEMKKGTSMPRAWVHLSPQIPGAEHEESPSAYCVLK